MPNKKKNTSGSLVSSSKDAIIANKDEYPRLKHINDEQLAKLSICDIAGVFANVKKGAISFSFLFESSLQYSNPLEDLFWISLSMEF